MIVLWGIAYGLPCLAIGGVILFSPVAAAAAARAFARSRAAAAVLSVVAWFWTAYECDIIGIDAFDAITKRFPGELWILAAVLSFLVVKLMPEHLPVRALSGLLMLAPAGFFRTSHAYRPEAGTLFASVDLMVLAAYAGAVAGMYGMFYPWRIEKAGAWLLGHPVAARAVGALFAVAGGCVAAVALSLA